VYLDGNDVLPELMASHGEAVAEQAALPLHLLEELGVVPSPYLQYFYRHDSILAGQLEGTPRAEVVAEIERGLLELYRDPSLSEKPALLEQRGGAFYSEAATGLVTSLVTGDGVVHEVDLRNDGTLVGLADDDVVEVPARVQSGRLVALPQEPLAPELLGLTQHVAAYERLAAQAAATGDLAIARKALLAHPLVGQHPLNEELVESLLAAEVERLPAAGKEALA
jgi:6-phospho-beta-glucosidase